jgi:signal transduction histidine kinase
MRALARPPSAVTWNEVRHDPGCVLLIVRQCLATQGGSALPFFPALVRDPAVLEGAECFLEGEREMRSADRGSPGGALPASFGFVDWGQPRLAPIYQGSRTCAGLAYHLAQHTGRCDPDLAWVGGLLAPLGWLAVAAVDADQAAACLEDAAFGHDPPHVQQRLWGLDQAGIARRLALRWQLPGWLAAVSGYLGLPVEMAKRLGADPDLFLIVQLAVRLAQEPATSNPDAREGGVRARLHLEVGAGTNQIAGVLGLSPEQIAACRSQWAALPRPEAAWESPQSQPLLRDLLCLAAENRTLENRRACEHLEREVDALHQALHEQMAGETRRLQAQKLNALAEFAAGAGHEINNPLAIISGQAQYLLKQIADGSRANGDNDPSAMGHLQAAVIEKALQTIVNQTRRVHHVLTDLMQFARPPRPDKQPLDAAALVRDVTASLQDLAIQRRVRLIGPELDPSEAASAGGHLPHTLHADRQQVSTALACLLRNAIEAAPADGWAGVRLETPAPDRLELVVEDNGSGPPPAQREHLFDPFYSGRSAGRGRGLGLATAWRLAREHGGDVRFDSRPGGPTRFVLSLPLAPHSANGTEPPAASGSNGVSHAHP